MSSFFEPFAARWWGWTSAMSVQVAVLVALIVLVEALLAVMNRLWARRPVWPELFSALWLLVPLKLLLPPSLSSPLAVAQLGSARALAAASPLEPGAGTTPPTMLLAAWLAGTVLLAAFSLQRARRLRREWLGSRPVTAPRRVRLLARSAAARLGLRRLPPIYVSQSASGAAVLGAWRPVVVIPAALARANATQLEHVLLHELAHVRRRDPLVSLVLHAVQLAYWFHPLVWLARARVGRWREVCCDREVARVLAGATTGYRRTLLELARPLLAQPPPGLGFVSPQSQILARLAWLERPLARWPLAERAATLVTVLLMLVCCLPMAHRDAPRDDLPVLSEQRGCMQLRYAVFAHLRKEQLQP